jgi:hypothetical protein
MSKMARDIDLSQLSDNQLNELIKLIKSEKSDRQKKVWYRWGDHESPQWSYELVKGKLVDKEFEKFLKPKGGSYSTATGEEIKPRAKPRNDRLDVWVYDCQDPLLSIDELNSIYLEKVGTGLDKKGFMDQI